MKVLLINGSPNEIGSTYTALCEVEKTLKKNSIETEIFYLGKKPISGCISCGNCAKTGKCVFEDCVNYIASGIDTIDGLVVGTPVYYAGATGQIISFLDRLFRIAGSKLAGKPAAAVAVARRCGTTAAFDAINKYFSINSMPIVTSNYWNQVYGATAEDVLKDTEGLQTMRILGENMAWLLRLIENGRKNGVAEPKHEAKIKTNFI